MKKQNRRVYEELRSAIEEQGGKMTYIRSGTRYGAWIVEYNSKIKSFESNGAGFPELDKLYVPKVPAPSHWKDYTNEIIPNAVSKLLRLVQ